jgi:hypothetical protein
MPTDKRVGVNKFSNGIELISSHPEDNNEVHEKGKKLCLHRGPIHLA